MIVFDYQVLADDSHRRQFIEKPWDYCNNCYELLKSGYQYPNDCECGRNPFTWEESWESYYCAAADDKSIEATLKIMESLLHIDGGHNINTFVQVWCDMPQTHQHIVENWLDHNTTFERTSYKVMFRPDGDTTPGHHLKEKWIKEMIKYPELQPYEEKTYTRGDKPEMAFELAGSPMIETWRSYGVPCFEVHV